MLVVSTVVIVYIETYFMAQAIVNAVVPDELRQARNVKSVHEGGVLVSILNTIHT